MFGKKKCSNCNKEVKAKFDYCPYCASPLRNPKDYGLLGNSDDIGELDRIVKGSLGAEGDIFEKLLGSAMKMIQNEIGRIDAPEQKIRRNPGMKSSFQLYINGMPVQLPSNVSGIQIGKMPRKTPIEMEDESGRKISRARAPKISEDILKNSAKLPRKEPKSKIMRLKDKIVYELETPGLNSLDKVLINKLENSTEIKAFTEKAVFIKTFPAKLPLMQYSIENGKLLLEFKA